MKLSVSMIVKNESACIGKALASVQGADELIVCDTGSTDNTIEIAKGLGATVFTDYRWNDNFAEARNYSLSKCTGDWILIIDADEILEPFGIQKVKELIGECKQDAVYFLTVAEGGSQHHFSIRLFRRKPEIYWKGAAHNYLSISVAYVSDISITYGYSEAHKLDPDRTLRILFNAVKQNPRLPRETFYLAREYYYRAKYKTAIKYYLQYLSLATWAPEMADAQVMIAKCYLEEKDYAKAREHCFQALVINADFKEAFLLMAVLSGPKNASHWNQIASMAKNADVLFIR